MALAVSHQAARLREALVAHLAHVVPLAGVRLDVRGQAAGMVEALLADLATVRRLLAGVRADVRLQVARLGDGLGARGARVGLLAGVCAWKKMVLGIR